MTAYAAGDREAFREIVARYGPPLLRAMLRHLPAQHEAHDLVQQTFLQLHRSRNDFDGGQRLRPWVYTIALNLKREYFRTRKRRPTTSLEEASLPEPSAGAPEAERRDTARHVRAAVGALPPDQREVIELHWFDGLSFPEIGSVLGITTNAAKVRAHRGYCRLREALLGELGPGNRSGPGA